MPVDDSSEHDSLIQFLYRAPIGLLQTDLRGDITMINPMSAQLLLPLVPDGNLTNLFDVLDPYAPELRRQASTPETGYAICDGLRIQHRLPGPGHAASIQTLSISLMRLDDDALVASITDATAVVQREQQQLDFKLKDASRLDALTGLPNRMVVMERIAAALNRASIEAEYLFAVLYINCDRFDRVNVTLGPRAGDELLRLIGSRLTSAVRRGDALDLPGASEPVPARLGNDEFALVIHGMAAVEDVHAIAHRVVETLASPFMLNGNPVHLTASVGILLRGQALEDAEGVLLSANIAMQEAKRTGGARYHVFEAGMKERASKAGEMEIDLRRGIEERQLFVVYQPIVAIDDGRCVGLEALVRWRHPVRGVVPPVEFIGLAEETGQIAALGELVLDEACHQLASWRRSLGPTAPATVCVNVSRAQLVDGSFTAKVAHALRGSGLAARHLQLEVTESLAAQDAAVIAQLNELKALGVSLALDDFGTGYSSLSSLHQLPVDVVKIDRSFVSQVESSAHHRVLVQATVMVAQSLGMTTVAEGIETEGQLSALEHLGCDKAQGYLLSRPMTVEAASDWLSARSACARPRTASSVARQGTKGVRA